MDPRCSTELERSRRASVEREGDQLVIKHLYIERRMMPLDLYLDRADQAAAARTPISEFGHAMQDLADANIFPGDLLLKNFGITARGRVVFYDYDEISLLTDVSFRALPTARDEVEEAAAEPWFHVGARDVFPEEFLRFLFPPGGCASCSSRCTGTCWTPRGGRPARRRSAPAVSPTPSRTPRTSGSGGSLG